VTRRRRRQLLKSLRLRTAEALKSQKLPDVPLIMQALPGSRAAKLTHSSMRTFADSGCRYAFKFSDSDTFDTFKFF
jgi:hypothetical protein